MTKAQYKVLGRLRKKQTNHSDIAVVESSSTSCTIYLPFPGFYLTYDNDGKLILTETIAERKAGSKTLAKPGGNELLMGELGSDVYKTPVYDDDVPF